MARSLTETRLGVFIKRLGNQPKSYILPLFHYLRALGICCLLKKMFYFLGSSNGSINYIDMQKFPLRMKDNDLLVTELYRDPQAGSITAISVYLTPKTSNSGNWIEIAYGTSSGAVRVIVQVRNCTF